MTMNWADERYVRVYTRDTPTWLMLPWQARACFPLICRKCDRAGVIDMGSEGLEGLAVTIGLPLEVVQPGVEGLAKKGTVELTATTLVIPKFIEAQETPQSDVARKRAEREKRRDTARSDVTKRDDPSQNVTKSHEPSRAVTSGHAESRGVTPSRAEPCLAVPNQKKNTADKPPVASDRLEVLLGRLAASFREVTGSDYRGNGHDTGAVRTLMGYGPDDEVDRRWRVALVAKYPKCANLRELARHWDHFAAKGPPGIVLVPVGAAGRRVGAEQVDWTGQRDEVSSEF